MLDIEIEMCMSLLAEYNFERFVNMSAPDPHRIIYNIPVTRAFQGQLYRTPFQLSEREAYLIVQDIMQHQRLMRAMSESIVLARIKPRPEPVDGYHVVDQNLLDIGKLIEARFPNAPGSLHSWFCSMAYDFILKGNQ